MGMITHIQRCSIHDGPGIRTTVFLKGCPLHCARCPNPKGLRSTKELAVHVNHRTGCGQCADVCPIGTMSLFNGAAQVGPSFCTSYFHCVPMCPGKALSGYGRQVSSIELTGILLRDQRYYEQSGGGVTFSGGEPLMQAAFVRETAQLLKMHGIHTAMETSCFAKGEILRAIMPYIDCFMVDIKAMDSEIHQNYTGVDNASILDNIVLLSDLGAEVLIRVPVVTGINDTENNMDQLADFLLTRTHFRQVELLKMHTLAQSKCEALNRPYEAEHISMPEDNRLQNLSHLLTSLGLTVIDAGKEAICS